MKGTYTPGAEGRGRSEGIEPPWKSLSVIVLPLTFFFDIVLPFSPSLTVFNTISTTITKPNILFALVDVVEALEICRKEREGKAGNRVPRVEQM